MINRLIISQLPQWARPEHPVMRYAIGYGQTQRRTQWIRLVALVALLAVVIVTSYAYTDSQTTAESPPFREFMYYPVVGVTILMQVLALAITTNSVVLERQKGTWESLQITLTGASTSIRARWMSVFYRLRWLIAFVVVARIGYLVLLMRDMTDFEGRAIDVRIVGIAPEVSLEVAVFLLAALMTAAVLQPFVVIAFDAAIGMVVATITRSRNLGILTTILLLGMRLIVSLSALFLGNQIIDANGTTPEIINMTSNEAWTRTLFLVSQGDLSLRILSLETLGNLWADLENGIYIGGVVLVVVLIQAVLANGMVLFAAWRAGKPTRK